MKISTKYHGEIEVNERELWHFSNGIPGFPEEKAFLLYPLAEEEVFSILQSATTHEVAFVVTSPFAFFQDYDFTLDESSITTLDLQEASDALPLVILTLGESLAVSTANLQAPIILNTKNKQGKQVILHNTSYQTKHLIKEKVEKR